MKAKTSLPVPPVIVDAPPTADDAVGARAEGRHHRAGIAQGISGNRFRPGACRLVEACHARRPCNSEAIAAGHFDDADSGAADERTVCPGYRADDAAGATGDGTARAAGGELRDARAAAEDGGGRRRCDRVIRRCEEGWWVSSS